MNNKRKVKNSISDKNINDIALSISGKIVQERKQMKLTNEMELNGNGIKMGGQ